MTLDMFFAAAQAQRWTYALNGGPDWCELVVWDPLYGTLVCRVRAQTLATLLVQAAQCLPRLVPDPSREEEVSHAL